MKNKKGFTLVELLVVIAIIGILSTVAVVNLNSARDKAKVAAVKAQISGLASAVVLCNDNNLAITNGAATPVACSGAAWTESGQLCSNPALTWPDLGTSGTPGTCANTVTTGVFTITATATDSASTVITCTEAGCS